MKNVLLYDNLMITFSIHKSISKNKNEFTLMFIYIYINLLINSCYLKLNYTGHYQ